MYNYNQRLHFVGIGGIGMAGIAEVLLNLGYQVSGSDEKHSPLIEHLVELGATVAIGHNRKNVEQTTSVVIVSSAIQQGNSEVVEAESRCIPIIPRAEMLGELMRMKYGIAVAGSHGKTTTTSMVSKILDDSGLDPTVIVGGRVLTHRTGARLGMGPYLVAEADESDGSFCLLKPAIAVATNIDCEHLGHYGSFGGLESAFRQFIGAVPFYGLVVACFDDPVLRRLCDGLKRRVVSFGLSEEAEIHARNIVYNGHNSSFTLYVHGQEVSRITLPLPGAHMISNALAAAAVSLEVGVYPSEIVASLENFPGVARRSEILFNESGILVLDDYAHHPTEIRATLRAIRAGWGSVKNSDKKTAGRIIALFQPHRYSRVRELFVDFLGCFSDADEVIVTDIYSAGEEPIPGLSAEKLALAIQHPKVSYVADLNDAISGLLRSLREGDIAITLGAGSIVHFGHQLAAKLRGKFDG